MSENDTTRDQDSVEMFVGGLMLDPNTQTPVVILKDESGENCLPIWIGAAEATSIASAIKQVELPRPLTHDLLHEILSQLGVTVKRVIITELRDATYMAELMVSQGDRVIVLDSRPSDAIGVAIRADAPIFVAQRVLEQAKISLKGAQQGEGEQQGEGVLLPTETTPVSEEFSDINKEQWSDILNSLDAEDFKYKV
jgi:bifunctional DNase/RNase